MEEAYILLLLFGGTAYAFLPPGDSICNGNQEKSHCSVTLGGSVYIQVMPNVSGHRLNCKKLLPSGPILVFAVKKEKLVIQKDFRSRTQFFINNGTLKISSVEKIDSGKYTVEVFDSSGHCVKIIEVELDVQENRFSILIPVCSALAALLVIVVLSCCVYKKMRCNRKSGSSKSRKKGSSKSRKKETTVEYWKTSDRMEDSFQHGLN
ncbi:uncharacterized protein si:zfos-741a10.3 [Corythoichthys intestinalis]|uniref:uncharacterized protein si:zfos-741a10.3 n=1 Tax=Corythoichthys intestinalis TaxID=161448 RepID=UPI0025A63A29|nr:uncharacterized protein si:zfos-741a10.3 [Corythoichthys intestinalis]